MCSGYFNLLTDSVGIDQTVNINQTERSQTAKVQRSACLFGSVHDGDSSFRWMGCIILKEEGIPYSVTFFLITGNIEGSIILPEDAFGLTPATQTSLVWVCSLLAPETYVIRARSPSLTDHLTLQYIILSLYLGRNSPFALSIFTRFHDSSFWSFPKTWE